LTQAQLDALNSGITSGKVSTYDGYASTISWKQDALTLPATPTQWNLVVWGADNETLTDGWAVPTGVPSWWNNWDVLTNVSGTPTWVAPSWITKVFTLASTSDLTTAQAAYDWYVNWWNPILKYWNVIYVVGRVANAFIAFSQCDHWIWQWKAIIRELIFTISSSAVTAIADNQTNPIIESNNSVGYKIQVSTTTPASWTANTVITFVTA
jgi:hypothetical protein